MSPVPTALIIGLLEFVKAMWPKKTGLNSALDKLIELGLNLEAFKSARKKIDDSTTKNAAEADPTKRECVVLEPEEAAALDFAMDHLAQILGSAKDVLRL